MASNDSMSESRVQALTALLPEIRTKLAVAIKSFQNHLARGTKYGFLTDDEMFEVFSGDNAAKHVDVLFKTLKGKNNEAFDGFCSILEENEYDHWSATLQKKRKGNILKKIGDKNLREFFYLKRHEVSVGGVIKNGEGKFSDIREATWYGRPCAVKTFKINPKDKDEMKQVEREAYTWAAFLRHPNVVQFYGLLEGSSPEGLPSVVMERLTINLQNFLANCRTLRDSIPLDFKRAILLDVCGAMAFLHSQSIIHRDLKGKNILLTTSLVAKVSDFTTARVYDTIDKAQLTKGIGDPNYAAPEVEDEYYDSKVDVYSFGSVIVLTLTHKEPVPKGDVTWCASSGYARREYLLTDLSKETKDEFQPLLEKCFDSPENRPSFDDIQKDISSKPSLEDADRYEIMTAELDNLYAKGNKPTPGVTSNRPLENSERSESMPEESCPSVEEEVAPKQVNMSGRPHEQGLQDDHSPKGLRDDHSPKGLQDDHSPKGLQDDHSPKGLQDDHTPKQYLPSFVVMLIVFIVSFLLSFYFV